MFSDLIVDKINQTKSEKDYPQTSSQDIRISEFFELLRITVSVVHQGFFSKLRLSENADLGKVSTFMTQIIVTDVDVKSDPTGRELLLPREKSGCSINLTVSPYQLDALNTASCDCLTFEDSYRD